jgi:hypothetical protein
MRALKPVAGVRRANGAAAEDDAQDYLQTVEHCRRATNLLKLSRQDAA